MASTFPLSKVTTPQLQQFTRALWSWSICVDCSAGKACQTEECPWQRATILGRFFQFYKEVTASYEADMKLGQQPGLSSHEDLLIIIEELKSNPKVTREALLEKLFTDRPARGDQERAINIAVRVMMMITCSTSRHSSVLLEHGSQQVPWRSDVPFSEFITSIFPKTEHPSIDHIKENLKATKLKKRAGLRFEPTDDLRNHLKLDRKRAVVEIFHHTAFLKEQLRITKDKPQDISMAESIKLGVLPRALALETLATLQTILFPLTEAKSKALLLSLTSTTTQNFDTDVLRYDSSTIRDPLHPESIPYHYFGSRLGDLYEELTNPTPRGMEKWFERRSGARYVMMATIAGVFLAIFLGMASLALGGYQAWVGYQQWQHPINPV
ncbi:hypothetical protein N431DRAFT_541349 [Stipitochalara longipes BDJ]|nr:hypothetical protein N431DRAFT_541349 [Stipitochalara longipes BDJ]